MAKGAVVTLLRAALDLAKLGFRVLPIEPGGKAPISKLARHGVYHSTSDPAVIEEWWDRVPTANLGIACSGLLVLDVDPRNGGAKSLATLHDQFGPMPVTPTQRTGGGGLHFVFRVPVVSMVSKVLPGCDLVHGPRRYIVAAPSLHASGERYEWTTDPAKTSTAETPDWLVMLGRRYEPPPMRPLPKNITHGALLARAAKYASKLDPAVSGSYGHNTAFRAACAMVRNFSALTDDEIFAVLGDWNATCQPPWSERDLRRKISQARSRAA